MHITGVPATLVLSPFDLSSFVGCRHRAGLDLAVAQGTLPKPTGFDLAAQALRDRGAEHERQYVESLRAQGLAVVDVRESSDRLQATREALARGADVVVQGALAGDAGVVTPTSSAVWTYRARSARGPTRSTTRNSHARRAAAPSCNWLSTRNCWPTCRAFGRHRSKS